MTRYEVIERIGVGGMAEVFRGRATAVGGFEKPVAIKKILPHLSSDNRFVQLLIAEAKVVANLRQRNIVQVYDVGLGDDGAYFLVMEYVDGRDLASLFDRMEKRRERFSVDLALFLGSEVCEALDHAHRATDSLGKPLALVHRDVSPSNVLMSRSGEVKLTDFGIAKKVDTHSVVQQIAGKFAYMSPEQASGTAVNELSDIYSLGVILWELLLGRRFYAGVPEVQALELARQGRVTRPRDVDPGFSRELEGTLLKALSLDPGKRWPSAAAFGAALRDYRYAASTAGDPAREIQALLNRHFGAEGGSREPTGKGRGRAGEQSRVLRIDTVFGVEPGNPAPPAKRIFDNFDAPTVAAPDGILPGLAPPVVPSAAAAGQDKKKPALAGFESVSEDAETRMLEVRKARPASPTERDVREANGAARDATAREATAREPEPPGRAATPTVRDLPMGALLDRDRPARDDVHRRVTVPTDPHALAARRRAIIATLTVLIVLALSGIAVVQLVGSGDDDEAAPKTPAAVPTGDPLEGPVITPPVKKAKEPR